MLIPFLLMSCMGAKNAYSDRSASFQWTSASKRLLLAEPDVEVSEYSAGGIQTVRADWTLTVSTALNEGLQDFFARKDTQLVRQETLANPREIQLVKLQGAIGAAIARHTYSNDLKLPNKENALDWTLGPGSRLLREKYNADYALFVFVRDGYSSADRVALVIGAALLGVGVPGAPQQIGFASLVDLRNGRVVWFNRLLNAAGDLRTSVPAKRVVDALVKGIPL